MNRNHMRLLLLLALLGLMPVTALADCNSITVNASTLVFGNYNPLTGTAITSQTTITAESVGLCSSPPLPATFSAGPGGSGTQMDRYMVSAGNDHLHYNLYTTAARSIVWGNGAGGTSTLTYTVSACAFDFIVHLGCSASVTIYGKIPAATAAFNNVTPGSYSDSVMVTVTF